MMQSLLQILPLIAVFVFGMGTVSLPGLIRRWRDGSPPGGGFSPSPVSPAGEGAGQALHLLAGLFDNVLKQSHAERTGTFIPSAMQKADIEKLASELLAKKLAEIQAGLAPKFSDPSQPPS